jgi:predicted HTH transcriptional regulator
MVNIIGVSQRSIERNLKKLQIENKLKRIGADIGGYWELNEI